MIKAGASRHCVVELCSVSVRTPCPETPQMIAVAESVCEDYFSRLAMRFNLDDYVEAAKVCGLDLWSFFEREELDKLMPTLARDYAFEGVPRVFRGFAIFRISVEQLVDLGVQSLDSRARKELFVTAQQRASTHLRGAIYRRICAYSNTVEQLKEYKDKFESHEWDEWDGVPLSARDDNSKLFVGNLLPGMTKMTALALCTMTA
jgi:hypothetical protein